MFQSIFKFAILAIFVEKFETTNVRHYWPLSVDQGISICSKGDPIASFSLDELISSYLTFARIVRFSELQCGVTCFFHHSECSFFQVNFAGSNGNCSLFSGIPHNLYYGRETSCKMFSQTTFCYVNISSWGFDDKVAKWDDSFVQVVGSVLIPLPYRGINTVEFDPVNCAITKHLNFNYSISTPHATAMKTYLESLPGGTIVIGQTFDDASTNLDAMQPYLASIGLNTSSLKFRGKFAFVIKKGFVNETVFALRNGVQPLSMQVAITKSSPVGDGVKFVRIY